MRNARSHARRLAALGLTAIVAAGVLGACGDDGTDSAAEADTTIRVGALLDLSSVGETLGTSSRAALEAAVADLDAEGVKVELDVRDTASDPATALEELQSLADDGVRIVIGPQTSSEAAELLPVANSEGMLVISQGSTASRLATAGDALYRMVPTDKVESKATVGLLVDRGHSFLVEVGRDDAGNAGLVASVGAGAADADITVADPITYPAEDAPDFGPVVQAVTAALADAGPAPALYLAGFGEVSGLLAALEAAGLPDDLAIYGGDGSARSDAVVEDATAAGFAAAHGGFASPLLTLSQAALDASSTLRSELEDEGADPDAFALGAYDALRIVALAVAEVGADAEGADLRDAFAGAADGYEGVTGTVTLDEAGDRATGAFAFWSVCPTEPATWDETGTWEPGAGAGTVELTGCPEGGG